MQSRSPSGRSSWSVVSASRSRERCSPSAEGVGVKTTDANGMICVDNLAFATYSVVEKSAPAGYKRDDTTSSNIVVDNNAKCSDSPFVGETKTYTDTPLTDVLVKVTLTGDRRHREPDHLRGLRSHSCEHR